MRIKHSVGGAQSGMMEQVGRLRPTRFAAVQLIAFILEIETDWVPGR